MAGQAVILYCSIRGTTRKVVRRACERFSFSFDLIDAATPGTGPVGSARPLIVFCPTYGDEELPEPMERFLVRNGSSLAERDYGICELGNYYGYEKFDFGALRILDAEFQARGGRRIVAALSLDSLPRVDWQSLWR